MRCLYCGKELALLKRLRGGGDFCSDAHKKSYQEEYNRLALSRLLQAQKKGQQSNNSPAQNAAPPPQASVALEEPVRPGPEEASGPVEAPVLEVALMETALPEDAPSAVAIEESATEAVLASEVPADVEPPASEEPEPVETAGFLLDRPAIATLAEETPHLEPWLEVTAGPAMSEWQLKNGAALSPSPAELVALDLLPKASSIADQTFAPDLSPRAFTSAQPDRHALSAVADIKKVANQSRLPASGAIAIDIAPSLVVSYADQSFVQAIQFESTVLFDDSQLLELSPTGIDFPSEDSDVVVLVRSRYNGIHGTSPALVEPEPGAAAHEAPGAETPSEDNSPRASLEALSRLHQELAEQEAAPTEPSEAAVDIVEAIPVEVIALPEAEPAEEEPKPPEKPAKPKFSTERFDISIRTFPPPKATIIGGDPHLNHSDPLLPHLKSLPLRPKVALARGYEPSSNSQAASAPKPAAPTVAAAHAQVPSKPAASGKPSARLTQPKQPGSSAAQAQATAKGPVARSAVSPKAVPSSVAVQEPIAARANVPGVTPKAAPVEKAPATETVKPPVQAANPTQSQAKPTPPQAKPTADSAEKDSVPSFNIDQPGNNFGLGSLKVKLGLAILLLVIACVYFLGWGGGKPHNAVGSNPVNDGSGPSIIMGEGGWVEGWAGDPTGLHAGRQITIYRPSLKLSDYRLEFQGSIDVKSIGWVFRASDPNNYYAMKLMTVSSGLSSRVALFKYLVADGRQTQVGRVPIDLEVHPDTVFKIRVDVRGPQFTTYIQGQQVDSWTDDQLKIGGAGFLNEREERGNVKSVSIRYLNGAGAK